MSMDLTVPTALADLGLASNGETPNLTGIVPTRNEETQHRTVLARLGRQSAP